MTGAWRTLTNALTPAVLALLAVRRYAGKEHPARWPERLGRASAPRPAGRLVWLHAASVGECLSVVPLIDALLETRPDVSVLMTTGTRTSAEVFQARAPALALHQFAPVDLPWAAARFMNHWRPDAAIWVESELWPNLITAAARRGAAMALINGRMSARAAGRWARWPGFAKRLTQDFRVCVTQTEADAERFRALGFTSPQAIGSLKDSAPPPPVDETEHARLAALTGARPVWAALSIHPGEAAAVAEAHRIVRARHPDALCIALPRHPPKAAAMRDVFQRAGLQTAMRAAGEDPQAETDVYLAGAIGETGTLASLAGAAFVGKSLGPLRDGGGQNPLEPAKLGLPVVFGPNMQNFQASSDAMLAAGAAVRADDAAALGEIVSALLADSGAMRDANRAFCAGLPDVLGRTLAALAPLLDKFHADA